MRLAIHHREGSFSTRWAAFCAERRIPYAPVNCLDSSIFQKLGSVDGLLWHWNHSNQSEVLAARAILRAAEMMGLAVFPSIATCWHFDDKLAQKYLLEALGAPFVPTHVFYEREKAFHWIDNSSFPKVFKLRKGAGSANVRLVRTRAQAKQLTRKAFSVGFKPIANYWNDAGKRYRSARSRGDLLAAFKRLPRNLLKIRAMNHAIGFEREYVYFQDFLPGNRFDTRVTVIGDRAFAFTRNVRPGDFRASGSGSIDYDITRVRLECVEIAFDIARRTGSQSMAFDFVFASDDRPMIVEVSYCYDPTAVYHCPGHWNRQLRWEAGHVWPQDAILTDLLDQLSTPLHHTPTSGLMATCA